MVGKPASVSMFTLLVTQAMSLTFTRKAPSSSRASSLVSVPAARSFAK